MVAAPVVAPKLEEPRLLDDPEFSPADVDRWSWPNGQAMNGAEIDRMISRVDVFMRRSLKFADAERLADTLMRRDRDDDDRRVCLECARLRGRSCAAPAIGGMGSNVSHVALILQRCPAFQAVSPP